MASLKRKIAVGGLGLVGYGLDKAGFFDEKETNYDPMSAYTPQQRASVEALMSLASTGTGGGLTLGQQYGGDLGFYQQSPEELQALASIQGLLSGPEISTARETFTDLADTEFDPSDPKSGYAAFSRALARSGQQASDVLNREAAITGNRFGTAIAGEKADLAERMQDQSAQYLANLYQSGRQQQLAGAQGLQGLVGTQANLAGQIQQQASIARLLKDQEAKDKLNEFKRTRGEELSRIGLMQDQWQNPMGAITVKSPSMFSQLAPSIGAGLGYAAGGPIGAAIGAGISGLFNGSGSGNVPGTDKTQSEILGFDTSKYR